jgi:radical SAM family uncharacterized protein/radical SAM-linked protein
MKQGSIQNILPFLERPSRYLGNEINHIKKDPGSVDLRFALAFPDLYEIGMSHFGLQILYHILNKETKIAAERVFAPATDMEEHLRASRIPLLSLESQSPLRDFDIVGFSLLYELNYTNVLTILDLSNIPFYAAQRDVDMPLIIAGGPCTCNPEPVADFFDAMVIGEAEEVILHLTDAWREWRAAGGADKERLLLAWSKIPGVYIPSFFKPVYHEFGDSGTLQETIFRFDDDKGVKRAIIGNLNQAPFPDKPVIPYGNPVHDRLRIEIARGCTRGCRFCQAGMIYRPARERSTEKLLELVEAGLANTGYEDLSLLSLSSGDYGNIAGLMEQLITRCELEKVAVSLPSLRAGTLTPRLMELIRKIRKTGFTIAPEAASQRLRDVINKNISQQDIIDTVDNAFSMGWQVIKLYFMIGLPTETDDDLEALVNFARELQRLKPKKGKRGKINISIGTFIPKSHTPFQWVGQIPLPEAKEKLDLLRDRLKIPRVQMKWQNPEVSFMEGLWARGDRRLSKLLVAAYEKGCRFDGWTDKFRFNWWMDAIHEIGIDAAAYTTRNRSLDEPLPWDHIDMGVSKSFLQQEWQKAMSGERTEDCRDGDCKSCGVCDFDEIEPKVAAPSDASAPLDAITGQKRFPRNAENQDNVKLKITFAKKENARFFGHLELVKIFIRAIQRSKIPVSYSKGFHPMPKIAFDDPLPVGIESEKETFNLHIKKSIKPQAIVSVLNAHLPDGISILACRFDKKTKKKPDFILEKYMIKGPERFCFNKDMLENFLARTVFNFSRTNRKGKERIINLRDRILLMVSSKPNELHITIKKQVGAMVRPGDILTHVFEMTDDEIKMSRCVKLDSEAVYK